MPDLKKLDLAPDTDISKRTHHISTVDEDNGRDVVDLSQVYSAAEQAENLQGKETESSKMQNKDGYSTYKDWEPSSYHSLPRWLQFNEFLHNGYRPQIPCFLACFRSIARKHTETGNIWTHLLGCILFIWAALLFLVHPSYQWEEKMVFLAFFAGAIGCLGFSATFHTVYCHSEKVKKLFNKLDYIGISFLITGSFVSWLYYGFYCEYQLKLIYFTIVGVMGLSMIIVSLPDKFSQPKFRVLRAGLFMGFGLSAAVPAIHYIKAEGWSRAVQYDSFGWFCLMGMLYIVGALLYATRIPERFYPGKFDIWFHSHQIFHTLVLAGAYLHYHGISRMAMYGSSRRHYNC